jgi:hypothetical protein
MKCVKCPKDATYDVPEDFCDYHWAEWWALSDIPGEVPLTAEEKRQFMSETVECIGRPDLKN